MKKNNNKGFSLVELIVVIAIMAVLVGVLAPSLLKYVEKSRVSRDAQNFDQIVEAMNVAAASEGTQIAGEDTYTVTNKKLSLTSTTAGSAFIKEVQDILGATEVEFSSTAWANSGKIEIKKVGNEYTIEATPATK